MSADSDQDEIVKFLIQEENRDILITNMDTKLIHKQLVGFRTRRKKKHYGLIQFKTVVLLAYGKLIQIKHPALYKESEYSTCSKNSSVLDDMLTKSLYLYSLKNFTVE